MNPVLSQTVCNPNAPFSEDWRVYGAGEPCELPCLGRVAAGLPIHVHDVPPESIEVPSALLRGGRIGDFYALRVAGESMIDMGIEDGDLVVIRKQNQAIPGQVVVALIEGEATLKKYHPIGPLVELRPCNRLFAPIRIEKGQLLIQGVMVGLWRDWSDAP